MMSRKMVTKALQSAMQCRCDQAADGSIAVQMIQQRMEGDVWLVPCMYVRE
jgi:hypothetical protein